MIIEKFMFIPLTCHVTKDIDGNYMYYWTKTKEDGTIIRSKTMYDSEEALLSLDENWFSTTYGDYII
jgi:hypothetical protein